MSPPLLVPRCILPLSALLLAPSTGAQTGEMFHERWRWVHFDAAEGLPAGRITHLLELEETPWVGGTAGLAWYDGWRWHAVPEEGLPDETLRGLCPGPAGNVLAAFPSGLFAGDSTGFEPLPLPFLTGDSVLTSVAALPAGEILLLSMRTDSAGRRSELHRWRAGTFERLELADEDVWFMGPGLIGSPSGRVWLNHTDGLWLWNEEGWTAFGPRPDRPVDLLAENAAGTGLLGMRYPYEARGLWTWDGPGEPRMEESEGHGIVVAASVGPRSEALVVYDTSAARFREDGRWSSVEPLPEALVQPSLVRFRADGDLWSANERGLWLLRRSSRRWTRFDNGGLNDPRDRIHSMVFDRDGALRVGTACGVERRAADGTSLPCEPLPQPAEVTGLALDERGELWVSGGGTFSGLHHWDGASWSRVTEDERGGALGLIHAIRPDRSGRLWLLGLTSSLAAPLEDDGSVHVLERGRITPWEHAGELANRRIYDCAETEDGALWFATSKGLSRFHGGVWRHWTESDGLQNTFVFRVVPALGGGVWIARQSPPGLARIDLHGNLQRVELDGVTSRCLDLALDERGGLWISTGSGLFLLEEERLSSFGYGAGLENLHAWPLLARGDKVYVGTLGGGLYVLDRAEAGDPAPQVVIQQPTRRSDRVFLRWTVHPWWGMLPGAEIGTRHRLDGGEWSPFSTERELVLHDLPSGTHTVEVQAKGLFGALGQVRAQSFAAGRLFYERRPFWIAAGVLLPTLLLLLGFHVVRRRRDAAALERREADYRTLMEGASDAIFWCDRTGICAGANPSACFLLGRELPEIVGAPLERFLSREDGGGSFLDALQRDRTTVLAVRGARLDGQPFHAEAAVKRVDGEHSLAIVRDVSERRALENERLALERSLIRSQRLESLGRLAGGVAHDFNNLLMLVMGHADQALERSRPTAELRANLEQVIRAAQRAGELTQKLLAFAGEESIEPRACDLGLLLTQLEDLMRSSVHPRARLQVRHAHGLPSVQGDPARLGQALLSLVINASEALGEREGEVCVATALVPEPERSRWRLEIDELPAGGELVALSVRDTGSGMDEETRQRAFEPFFTRKARARGLGLAAVAGIVRAHRGGIALESRPGAGTTFTLLFPAGGARADGETTATPAVSAGSVARGELVLVIDDDDAVRGITTSMLERTGFRTLAAASGSAGLALFRERSADILCTIVDLTMPGMSGLETRAALLAIRPDAAVLLTSGYNEELVREREWLHPQVFLRKPFTSRELEARLRTFQGKSG